MMPCAMQLDQKRSSLTLHAGLGPVLSAATWKTLLRHCTAVRIGAEPFPMSHQLGEISRMTSLQFLELHTLAESCMESFPRCWTGLRNLQSLTLTCCKDLSPVLAQSPSLHCLVIHLVAKVQLHLEALTQLIGLRVCMDEAHFDLHGAGTVFLPTGDSVEMQDLVLQHQGPTENLQYAIQLRRLDMTLRVASYIRGQWHILPPGLKAITMVPQGEDRDPVYPFCQKPLFTRQMSELHRYHCKTHSERVHRRNLLV